MLTESQQSEFDKCWLIYRSPGNRSKKGESLKKWESVVVKSKDPDLPKKIYDAIIAQNRYQTDMNESIQFNRGFQVWLNQQGWLDEIKSRTEKKKEADKICSCGAVARLFVGQYKDGENLSIGSCEKCYRQKLMTPEDRNRLKQNIKKHNLRKGENETSQEFARRMAQSLKAGAAKIAEREVQK